MTQPISRPVTMNPRRFLLLPEDAVKMSNDKPRIRRYRLASVGRRSGRNGPDLATASLARELGRMGRMR